MREKTTNRYEDIAYRINRNNEYTAALPWEPTVEHSVESVDVNDDERHPTEYQSHQSPHEVNVMEVVPPQSQPTPEPAEASYERVQCIKCEKSYGGESAESNRRRHMREKHEDRERTQCPYCQKDFSRPDYAKNMHAERCSARPCS